MADDLFEIIKFTLKLEGSDEESTVQVEGNDNIEAKIPEGTTYVTTVHFRAYKKLAGFRFKQVVTKAGIPLKTREVELGDFEPSDEIYKFECPADSSPSGFFFRGRFPAETKYFVNGEAVKTVGWTVEIVSK